MGIAKVSDDPRTFELESFDYDCQTLNLKSYAHNYHKRNTTHIGTKAIRKGTTTAKEAAANTTPSQLEARAESRNTPSVVVTKADTLVIAVNTDHQAPGFNAHNQLPGSDPLLVMLNEHVLTKFQRQLLNSNLNQAS